MGHDRTKPVCPAVDPRPAPRPRTPKPGTTLSRGGDRGSATCPPAVELLREMAFVYQLTRSVRAAIIRGGR
jgi:hypothetical protein